MFVVGAAAQFQSFVMEYSEGIPELLGRVLADLLQRLSSFEDGLHSDLDISHSLRS